MIGWLWIAAALALLIALALALHEARVYRRARGHLLRFDAPEARAALRDPDDWFDE